MMKWICGAVSTIALGCGNGAGARECIPGQEQISDPPPPTYDVASGQRSGCEFGPNDPTTRSVGSNAPAIPDSVKHVIVVMRENHSFDQYFSAYLNDAQMYTNPDPLAAGQPVGRFHEPRYCMRDANHEWTAAHLQFDNGRMDGFVASANDTDGTGGTKVNEGGGARVMGYYDGSDLPFYYWLASHFALSDHYFSSLLGPTHANLMFYYRATSCDVAEGFDTNPELTACGNGLWPDAPDRDGIDTGASVFDRINGDTSKVYSAAYPSKLSAAAALGVYNPLSVGSISDFEKDVANDALPALVYIEPDYGDSLASENDEHPPTNIQDGQALTFRIVNAVMSHPAVWQSTIMFLTWDENGGYFDHVQPPKACSPDDRFKPRDYAFDNYGFRVPLLVVSPFAKAGYVSSYVADHSSIVRFIEHWKHTGAITKRDANAWPLLDMFDFSSPQQGIPLPDPALAAKSTDPVHVGMCGSAHGGTGMP